MVTGTTGTTLSNRLWFNGRKVKCSYDAGEAMDFIILANKDCVYVKSNQMKKTYKTGQGMLTWLPD